MSKFAKIMLICFAAGIVLIGIGGTVAFCEISSIDYGGTKVYESGSENVTQTYEEKLTADIATIEIDIDNQDDAQTRETVNVVTDENIPEDKIIFELSYPADCNYTYNFSVEREDDDYHDDYHDDYDDYYDDDYHEYHYEGTYEHTATAESESYTDNTPQRYNSSNSLEASVDIGFYQLNEVKYLRGVVDDLQNGEYYRYIAKGSVTVKINPANESKIIFD